MTPKEKANELVFKYKDLVTSWNYYSDSEILIEDRINDMKKCALIAVDEILDTWYEERYWEEVKQEIEKL